MQKIVLTLITLLLATQPIHAETVGNNINPPAYIGYFIKGETGIYLDIPPDYDDATYDLFTDRKNFRHFDTAPYLELPENYIDLKDSFYVYDRRGLLGVVKFLDYACFMSHAKGRPFWFLRLAPTKITKKFVKSEYISPVIIIPKHGNFNPLSVADDTSYQKLEFSQHTDEMEPHLHHEYMLRNVKQQIDIRIEHEELEGLPIDVTVIKNGKIIFSIKGHDFGC